MAGGHNGGVGTGRYSRKGAGGIIETLLHGRVAFGVIDTILEYSCSLWLWGIYLRQRRERGMLRWLIWVWQKIGAIHQEPDLTNAETGPPGKGFLFKAVNQETCKGHGLVQVYQSASQLLYSTSERQPLRPAHGVPACWPCNTLPEGKWWEVNAKER